MNASLTPPDNETLWRQIPQELWPSQDIIWKACHRFTDKERAQLREMARKDEYRNNAEHRRIYEEQLHMGWDFHGRDWCDFPQKVP